MKSLIHLLLILLPLLPLACSGTAHKEEGEEHHEETRAEPGILEIHKESQEKAGLQFAQVEQTQMQNRLAVTGKVAPDESRVVHIRPPAAGRVQQVLVQPGSEVNAGQPLVSFDSVELGELESEYLKARADASVSQRAVQRAENLVKIGAIAEAEYERRKADHQRTLAALRNLETKARRYGLDPGNLAEPSDSRVPGQSILRSPISGVLLAYDAAAGEMTDPGRSLFTVGDLSTVWVEANVHETDLSLVQTGTETEIHSDAYPQTIFRGRILKVGDVLDVGTRTVKVRCQVPNSERKLKLEMFVDVVIPTSARRDVLMVPESAVQEIDHRPVVFVRQGEERFQKRDIRLGEKSEAGYEVISGLQPGEVVVAQGSFSLKSEFLKAEIGTDEHGH